MTTDDVRNTLRAIAAQCELALKALDQDPSTTPAPLFVSLAEYALRRTVSLATVKRWRKAGMPVSQMGRTVRVEIVPADEWVQRLGKAKPAK